LGDGFWLIRSGGEDEGWMHISEQVQDAWSLNDQDTYPAGVLTFIPVLPPLQGTVDVYPAVP
jgi:hypothetical protein